MRVTVVTVPEPPRPNSEAQRRECTACTRASSPNLNSCQEFRRDCLGECVLPALEFSPDGFFLLNNQYFLLKIKCPVKGGTCYGADLIALL